MSRELNSVVTRPLVETMRPRSTTFITDSGISCSKLITFSALPLPLVEQLGVALPLLLPRVPFDLALRAPAPVPPPLVALVLVVDFLEMPAAFENCARCADVVNLAGLLKDR